MHKPYKIKKVKCVFCGRCINIYDNLYGSGEGLGICKCGAKIRRANVIREK